MLRISTNTLRSSRKEVVIRKKLSACDADMLLLFWTYSEDRLQQQAALERQAEELRVERSNNQVPNVFNY
jgi:hypothetical protein